MELSACDIGNPIYSKSVSRRSGEGCVKAEIWFGAGEFSKFRHIDFEWTDTPDGIDVIASKPCFIEYIVGPDDLEFDVLFAIEEELGQAIRFISWVK